MVPLTIPRKLGQLRYASMLSVLLSFYLVMVIVIEGCLDHGTSPTLKDGWKAGGENTKISPFGFFNSFSTVIFAFMYQMNIPALYTELEVKTLPKIRTVVVAGTILAVCLYIMAGIFGYISFADTDDKAMLEKIFTDNILKAPYENSEGSTPLVIYISLFGMCVVVSIATPFCVLPCKDGIEEIRNKKFSPKENLCWTIVLNTIGACLALPFNTISIPITILGATTNSCCGFFLPIAFYLKLERKTSPYTNMKIISYIVFVLIAISSVASLIFLGIDLATGDTS